MFSLLELSNLIVFITSILYSITNLYSGGKENRMDELDRKTLRFLMTQGRGTWAELGKLLRLTAPAAAERARKLQAGGAIRGYAAIVAPEKLGFPLTAYVAVTL